MKYVLTHYSGDPSWVTEYTDDYVIFDRSDVPLDMPNTRRVPNLGNADYDRLSYIVENYEVLPDVFLLSKSNLFKYIEREEFDKVKDNNEFTPLLSKNHKVYGDILGAVCYYDENGMYRERNNSWYLNSQPARFFQNFDQWCIEFGLPREEYIPFAPGGNYILTRERVHRQTKQYYERMRECLPYSVTPGEAQFCERSYYYLWS